MLGVQQEGGDGGTAHLQNGGRKRGGVLGGRRICPQNDHGQFQGEKKNRESLSHQ